MNGLEQLLPFVLIAVVFWLLLIRPQRRRQLELNRTQTGLQVGDEVLLGAGIAGRVASLGDEYLQVEVAPGVELKVARQAIIRVLHAQDAGPSDVPDEQPPATPGDHDTI